jgi:hypothetical protein
MEAGFQAEFNTEISIIPWIMVKNVGQENPVKLCVKGLELEDTPVLVLALLTV